MKDKDHLRIRAAFDQAATAARHAGGKMVAVSEIELIYLATMAKYGLYAYLHRNGPFLLEEIKEKLDNMDRVIRSFGTFKEGDTPPFLANSAAGVACVQTGRRFIGIEIDEKYAAIARRRIADAAPLFVPAPKAADPALFQGDPA